MIPRGAAPLIAMRLAGQCPAGEVWITVGDGREPDWWKWSNTLAMPELLIRPEEQIERLDLRCVHGLSVVLFCGEWFDRAARVHDLLIEYAAEIAVMSPSFELDIGWRWIKGIGRVEFGETHWIKKYRDAQDDRSRAADRNDKAAYQAAASREEQIRQIAPWLKIENRETPWLR